MSCSSNVSEEVDGCTPYKQIGMNKTSLGSVSECRDVFIYLALSNYPTIFIWMNRGQ